MNPSSIHRITQEFFRNIFNTHRSLAKNEPGTLMAGESIFLNEVDAGHHLHGPTGSQMPILVCGEGVLPGFES
jgi:hypothetical protein